MWDVPHQQCPRIYSSYETAICFWPATLRLSAQADGGEWSLRVRVFEETFVPLPGTLEWWPDEVRDGEQALVVVGRDGRPAVKLEAGDHEITGRFQWKEMPQKLKIPQEIGVLSLQVDGEDRSLANWDTNGDLWLRRVQSQSADKDRLGIQVYRVIEDGIPVWLRTEIELTVSGKSREEELGWILPEGWQVATVETPIPVAIDDSGRIKAQVRAGKWSVMIHAFRTTDPGEIRFAEQAQPTSPSELVGLKLDPTFRISQIEGLRTVDVTQTTFPERWRALPVYQWTTDSSFQLIEKQRGMGDKRPEGLHIERRLWLDEDGRALTYEDKLRGKMQRIWRLDVASPYELGAVRVDGESQLITANPETEASGVEIRNRNVNMEAIGRAPVRGQINAAGWQTDAESLRLTLTLPPGWRALAIFGADRVEGDWLTAWSLLDLFLLLIFALAVFRMHGVVAGLIALLAFGLSYHEFGAPRWSWFFLLIPLALLRVVGEGAGRRWLQTGKGLAALLLLIFLIPFLARQLQGVIYPQLEVSGFTYGSRGLVDWTQYRSVGRVAAPARLDVEMADTMLHAKMAMKQQMSQSLEASNLLFDPNSKIQTGPARPAWDWNSVYCYWNGPVAAEDTIQPILISLTQHRLLTVLRVVLLIWLVAVLLGGATSFIPRLRSKSVAAVASALLCGLLPGTALGQLPDPTLLNTLRERLTEVPDAFPNAAEISTVGLKLEENRVEIRCQVHAAVDVAVPLPGKFPEWSPLSVTLDGSDDVLVTRRDGFLWVLVPQGVHDVVSSGLLADSGNWEWTFLLKPKRVDISAPGWNISGVNPEGVPDQQVFFVKEQPVSDDRAAYDQTDFNPIVQVNRHLEIGLVSRVRTEVVRLSKPGKAVSLQVPLLQGEGVLTANRDVDNGSIAVRLGAKDERFEWESELPDAGEIPLAAPQTDQWVERWYLVTSPVWNVAMSGLQPIFETDRAELVPVWQPWPGESVSLAFLRPTAISGDVLTVQHVDHVMMLGSRRRTSQLNIQMECSLATDFAIQINPDAEITTVKVDNNEVPPQRDGAKLVLPVNPGKHQLSVGWNTSQRLGTVVRGDWVELPADGANISTTMEVPENRWVLWAEGPLRGPAVRFWVILLVALLIALALGSLTLSPLRRWEWGLLAIGLTQVHLVAAMFVVAWLFALEYRGRNESTGARPWLFNLAQLGLVLLTVIALVVLMFVVGAGLLGHPDMFIIGNGSSRLVLRWFEPRSGPELPTPAIVSVSVWYYRLLMLFWALWLAGSLLRWLARGWKQFTKGGAWRRRAAVLQ